MDRLLQIWALLAGTGDASPLPSADLPSYGGLLLKTIIALVIVIALAWVFLRWGLKRILPGQARGGGEIEVLDRQPLDGRRSVVLVKAYGRFLLLGVAEGSVTLLSELDAEEVAKADERRAARPQRTFADVLRDTLRREPPAPEPLTPAPESKEEPAEETAQKEDPTDA